MQHEPTMASSPTVISSLMPSSCVAPNGTSVPCGPGAERCGAPWPDAPGFHVLDATCLINDPNGPVFDERHGMFHLFFQDHLAEPPGGGPVYGHACSRDLVHWARLPVAIWNDAPYDRQAIYSGSATIVDGLGIVQVYPGLCGGAWGHWSNCTTGTNLNVAVPADPSDPLLRRWTKPAWNPIVNNTQRDPSTAWRTAHGEWRLTDVNAVLYGSRDFRHWYVVGPQPGFEAGECPSLFRLPRATPGSQPPPPPPGEEEEPEVSEEEPPPTHVHKWSASWHDHLRPGVYADGAPGAAGAWAPTMGWAYGNASQQADGGAYYASKDLVGDPLGRRVMWGWTAYVGPGQGVLSLPRELTWHAELRQLVFSPLEGLAALRGQPALVDVRGPTQIGEGEARALGAWAAGGAGGQAEVEATFDLPAHAAAFGVSVMAGDDPSTSGMLYYAEWEPPPPRRRGGGAARPSARGRPASAELARAPPPAHAIRVGSVNLSISSQYARWMPNRTLWCCARATERNVTDARGCQGACEAAAAWCVAWTFVPARAAAGGAPAKCVLNDAVRNTAQTLWRPPQFLAGATSGVLRPSPLLGGLTDRLLLSPRDTNLTIRVFVDRQLSEGFWQHGRVAMTREARPTARTAGMAVLATRPLAAARPRAPHAATDTADSTGVALLRAQAWRVRDCWVSPEEVLRMPRIDR